MKSELVRSNRKCPNFFTVKFSIYMEYFGKEEGTDQENQILTFYNIISAMPTRYTYQTTYYVSYNFFYEWWENGKITQYI